VRTHARPHRPTLAPLLELRLAAVLVIDCIVYSIANEMGSVVNLVKDVFLRGEYLVGPRGDLTRSFDPRVHIG
jgi:hypothetical protein